MPVERLAIVGTGLIGASVGLAAREAGVEEVRGGDVDPDALAAASERGALEAAGALGEAVSGATLVVVAAPVAALPEQVAAVLAAAGAGANVLLNQAGSSRIDGHEPLTAAGGSLRDMTRVAGANPRIWVDIFLDNAETLAAALAEHRRRIEQVERALAAGDAGFLARWIGEASDNRRRMLADAYEQPGTLQRLRVHVPDRPGVLAGITQALGAERINIEDFELQHLSRERGGTLTLLIGGEDEAERARAILEAQGYHVVISPVLE